MNKVILMGRLTRDPETRFSQGAEPLAITRYSLAVNRRFKRDGEPDADFINCTAFRKDAEFAEKYFKKGQLVSIVGRLQVRNWEDQNGQKRVSTEVIIEEQHFAESKRSYDSNQSHVDNSSSEGYSAPKKTNAPEDFSSIAEPTDDDLPF